MTTHEIGEVLGKTDQQVRNIARRRGWEALKVGPGHRGGSNIFRTEDVEEEALVRLREADAEKGRIESWLRSRGRLPGLEKEHL